MRINEVLEIKNTEFKKAVHDFVPIAKRTLKLKHVPKIKFVKKVRDEDQPTFGKYVNKQKVIYIGIDNRHIVDILRTLAHELVHHKQRIENRLGPDSGKTGSPEENEAHMIAGVIMRRFSKKFPHYLGDEAVDLNESGRETLAKAGLVALAALGGKYLPPYNTTNDPFPAPSIHATRPPVDRPVQYEKEPGEKSSGEQTPEEFRGELVNRLMREGIKGAQLAQFLAQVAHETANFREPVELGDKEYFYKRYWYNKRVRKILGNITKEDAYNFRGRGLFHLTGRDNYTRCGQALNIDLVNNPDLAIHPNYQIPIALWYWKERVVDQLGSNADFSNTAKVTYYINKNAGPENIKKRDQLFQKFFDSLINKK